MNKRTRLKKSIIHKKCDKDCNIYSMIYDNALTTNNVCIGCKFRDSKEIQEVLKENELTFSKFKRVNSRCAEKIITTRKPKGLFWTKEDELYIAIDNQTGNAWTENFKTREECFEYLKGEKIK